MNPYTQLACRLSGTPQQKPQPDRLDVFLSEYYRLELEEELDGILLAEASVAGLRLATDSGGSPQTLASFYADLWTLLEAAGQTIPDDEHAAAGDELEGTGWSVVKEGGVYRAEEDGHGGVRLGFDDIRLDMEDWSQHTGPKGGVFWVHKGKDPSDPANHVYGHTNPGSVNTPTSLKYHEYAKGIGVDASNPEHMQAAKAAHRHEIEKAIAAGKGVWPGALEGHEDLVVPKKPPPAEPTSDAESYEKAAFDGFLPAGNWMGDHANRGLGSVDTEEGNSLGDYKKSGYTKINGALRGTSGGNADYARERVANLDRVMARSTIDADVYAQRGVASRSLVKKLKEAHASGGTVVDNGFVSTTLDRTVPSTFAAGKSSGSAVINLHVPAGTHAYAYRGSESELLLARGVKMVVENVRDVNGMTHFDVKVVGTGHQTGKGLKMADEEPSDDKRFLWEDGDLEFLEPEKRTERPEPKEKKPVLPEDPML